MRKRQFHTVVAFCSLVGFGLTVAACDAATEPDPPPQQRKKLSEMTQEGPEMSEEELAEARKKAGFKSQDEIAAENAAVFEKGAREYVLTRMKEYKAFSTEFRAMLDDIEKEAPKWADDAAFEKFSEKYKERAKAFTETYDKLTGHGVEGGNTQAILGKTVRTWEDLNSALGAGVGADPKFAETLKAIRDELDKVDAALAEIEKDETLVADATYEPPKDVKKK